MGHFDGRLRRLEEMLSGDRGQKLEEVQDVWGRVAESTRAKLRGEIVDEGQRARDRDTIERWARAEGAELENEAQRAKQKLTNWTEHKGRQPAAKASDEPLIPSASRVPV